MKLWGGRFREPLDPFIEEYHTSLPFDNRLVIYDIIADQAHAKALAEAGVISEDLADRLVKALEEIKEEVKAGKRKIKGNEAEDIHTLVENWLIEKIGEEAGFLRAYRSRNEQIACDERLYLKAETSLIIEGITSLQRTLVNLAEQHKDWVIPGYTHLQRAQPVLLSHHLLAYFWMFQRDRERFVDALKRIDISPEGAGALAGGKLDPKVKAELLGFSQTFENSLDAVSDRDFILEFLSACAICAVHLSRLADEIVLWSSEEFGFLSLSDTVSTGSSMMPHKKNPSPAEIIRGKTGRVIGALVSLFIILKGIPLTYNNDLQEDKPPLFDAIDTLKSSIKAMEIVMKNAQFNKNRMEKAFEDYLLAVEIADYLFEKGIPFRSAHSIVGNILLYALEKGKKFRELTIDEFKLFSPLLEEDVYNRLTISSYLEKRNYKGGTGEKAVEKQLQRAKEVLSQYG